MNKIDFSVLMSVYEKEIPEYLSASIKSIWDDQILKPNEIIIVKDGPLSTDLDNVLAFWQDKLGLNLKLVNITSNIGLAGALNMGLQHCNYELIARMDSDDISLPNRFQKQVEYMNQNPQYSVISAWIEEFDQTMSVSQGIRKTPDTQDRVLKFSKRRNPISHPVSIFRKSVILSVGGYPLFPKAQDYALWSLLLQKGYKITNLQEVLLHMRTGDGLLERRGRAFLKHEISILLFQRKIGFLNLFDFIINFVLRSFFRLQPIFLRRAYYKAIKKKVCIILLPIIYNYLIIRH